MVLKIPERKNVYIQHTPEIRVAKIYSDARFIERIKRYSLGMIYQHDNCNWCYTLNIDPRYDYDEAVKFLDDLANEYNGVPKKESGPKSNIVHSPEITYIVQFYDPDKEEWSSLIEDEEEECELVYDYYSDALVTYNALDGKKRIVRIIKEVVK